MARRVFFHIGAPKTGTTYLQAIMWHNRPALQRAGVLFAGEKYLDRVWATQTVREMRQPHPTAATAWSRIVEQVRRFDGDAIISHEFFGAASAEQAGRALDALAPAEVHLVFTARDLTRLLPALWQERLKYRFTDDLEGFDPEPLSAQPRQHWSWRTVDAADVLRRWGADLPASHVHVVTVPRQSSAPDTLWRRFAEACDVDPGVVDLDVPAANESMGLVESEFLRRVNPRLDPRIKGHREVPRWVRNYLALSLLAPREGERIFLDEATFTKTRERSVAIVDELRARGYDVVGDLEDLIPVQAPAAARAPRDIGDDEFLDVALDVIAAMLSDYRTAVRARDRLRAELAGVEPTGPDGSGRAVETRRSRAGRAGRYARALKAAVLKRGGTG